MILAWARCALKKNKVNPSSALAAASSSGNLFKLINLDVRMPSLMCARHLRNPKSFGVPEIVIWHMRLAAHVSFSARVFSPMTGTTIVQFCYRLASSIHWRISSLAIACPCWIPGSRPCWIPNHLIAPEGAESYSVNVSSTSSCSSSWTVMVANSTAAFTSSILSLKDPSAEKTAAVTFSGQ